MEIINNIIAEWIQEKNNIDQNLLKLKNAQDVCDFMMFIKVNPSECLHKINLSEFNETIKVGLLPALLSVLAETYAIYSDAITTVKEKGIYYIESFKQRIRKCPTNYDIILKICMIENEAIKLFNESSYQKYEYNRYNDLLELFVTAKAQEFGSTDSPLSNYKTDENYALTVCRISWEYYYLSSLVDVLELPNKNKIYKKERNNFIVRAWREDTEIMRSIRTSDENNFYYRIYRNVINEKKEMDINKFIKLIKIDK